MDEIEGLRAELAGLRSRVELTEASLAIRDLKARYGALADDRLAGGRPVEPDRLRTVATEIAALFTEDAIWDGGPSLGVARGREEIRERMEHPTLTFSKHFFLSPRLAVDGDEAVGRWDVLCPCIGRNGASYWMCGVEDDTYRREDGRWLHTQMVMTTVFFAPVGAGWDDAVVRMLADGTTGVGAP